MPGVNWRTVGKAASIAAAVTAARDLTDVVAKTRSYARAAAARFAYTVTISDDDPLYRDAHDALLAQIPTEARRKLTVRYNSVSVDRRAGGVDPSLVTYDDSSRSHPVTIGGEQVRVMFGVTDTSPPTAKVELSGIEGSWGSGRREPKRMEFRCWTPRQRDAVTAWLASLAESRQAREHPPVFNIVSRWGDWMNVDHAPSRPVDTVVLADGLMDRIVSDVERFLSQRHLYEQRGLPWHRGHLYHGPAGSGKSSIPRALATEFNLDMWYLPLGDIRGDTNLIQLVSGITTGGILLLEDIDVFAQTARRADGDGLELAGVPQQGEVSLSGLLNAIDGVTTPPGLIVCMTTNRLDVLDRALFRPGRIDVVEHVGFVDSGQAGRLFEWFYQQPPSRPFTVTVEVAAAEVAEAMKPHFDDPAAGEAAVRALLAPNTVDSVNGTGVRLLHAYGSPMAPTPSGSEVAPS